MEKLDLKKRFRQPYAPSAREPAVVDVPEISFLMVDGAGDPNTSERFQSAVEALYALSYTLKFAIKKELAAADYTVMPLEGLWWAEDPAVFRLDARDNWRWTLMIVQSQPVTRGRFEKAFGEAAKNKDLAIIEEVSLESFAEGLSAQVMHLGPYSDEGPTVERLPEFIREKGYEPAGKHHEIYLGEPRRTAPEKMKTVMRQPVK